MALDPLRFPHDPTIERSILGSILSKLVTLEEIEPPLTLEHFHVPFHRDIFGVLQEMSVMGEPLDVATVTTAFLSDARYQSRRSTIAFDLSEICSSATISISFYAGLLDSKLRLRRLYSMTEWIGNQIPTVEDVEAFTVEIETKISEIALLRAPDNTFHVGCDQALKAIEDAKNGNQGVFMPTTIPVYDRVFKGFELGRMDTIGARPGDGKSALVEQAFKEIAENVGPVVIFEKDMTVKKLVLRMACREAGVPLRHLMRGTPSNEECLLVSDWVQKLRKLPIHVESPARLTGADIRSRTKFYKKKHGIVAMAVDHFQILSWTGNDMRKGMTQNATEIKQAIHENEVAGIVLAQLNREAEKSDRPRAKDIKECDQLFADSDCVTLLSRNPNTANPQKGEPYEIECWIDKDREGAKGYMIKSYFDAKYMKFVPQVVKVRPHGHHESPEPVNYAEAI